MAAIAQARAANVNECTAIGHRCYRGTSGAIVGCRGNEHRDTVAVSACGYRAEIGRNHGTRGSACGYDANLDTDHRTGVSATGYSANLNRDHATGVSARG